MPLVQLGSGVNLLGYYMFQGGINPQGKLTTLQESQATDYPNDLPVKSYDFQAPLREFGQMNGSFRKIKLIHQFVADFGRYLAPMTAVAPDIVPSSAKDTTTPRLVARTQGDHGFLFFNNYVRNSPLPEHKGVQVVLKLPSETIKVPREPYNIPSQSSFFWPVNLDLGGALLKYATSQPLAKIDDGRQAYYFFVATEGIPPQFVFAAHTIKSVDAKSGRVSRQVGRVFVDGLNPSTNVAITVLTRTDKTLHIMLLSENQAENSCKISVKGRDFMLMTSADVFINGESVHLRSRDANAFSFSIFPEAQIAATASLRRSGPDGIFARYSSSVEPKQIAVHIEKVRDADPSPAVKMGKALGWRGGAAALAPDDHDFEKAAVWRLKLPQNALDGVSDVFLDIHYFGDVARLYAGAQLLDDNFFNGSRWEVGLKRFAPQALTEGMELKVLPLRKGAPIFIPKRSRPEFGATPELADVKAIKVSPEYEITFTSAPAGPAH